jgi:hypothetical protein
MTPGELLALQLSGDTTISNEDINNATVNFFQDHGVKCTIDPPKEE